MRTLDPRTLHQFREILDSIASAREHEYAFHLIVDRIERLFKCQTVAILIVDPASEYLVIESSYNISHTYYKSYRRKIATGAVGELLWTGVPVLVNDDSADPGRAEQFRLEHPFGSCIAVQMSSDHRPVGYLYLDSTRRDEFTEDDVELLRFFADMAAIAYTNARLHEQVSRLDTVDKESGMDKYAPFLNRLEEAVEKATHANERFTVVIGDVDNFKEISNVHGHGTSGRLLKELGSLLRTEVRVEDALARFGPDEFIILRPSHDLDDGIRFAKAVRQSIEQASFVDGRIRTTVSMGVACFPSNGRSADELLLTAKKALFEAQRSGRNSVYHYPSIWYESHRPVRDTD